MSLPPPPPPQPPWLPPLPPPAAVRASWQRLPVVALNCGASTRHRGGCRCPPYGNRSYSTKCYWTSAAAVEGGTLNLPLPPPRRAPPVYAVGQNVDKKVGASTRPSVTA